MKPPNMIPADTTAVTRIFGSEQFRDLMRRTVHAEFVQDEDGNTFEDRGFNLIDQMPININAAAQDVELDIPAYRATWERVADMIEDEIREVKDEIDQLDMNQKVQKAYIEVAFRANDPRRKQELAIPQDFNVTDKSVAAFVEQHASVIDYNDKRREAKVKLREKLVDLDFARHAVKALEMYHVSLQKNIDKRVYGMKYEVMPTNSVPPAGVTTQYNPPQPPRRTTPAELQPKKPNTSINPEDDPRAGMRTYRKDK